MLGVQDMLYFSKVNGRFVGGCKIGMPLDSWLSAV